MLTIPLDPTSKTPLYQQLCQGIRDEIAAGHLAPHEKLPSRRALAAHLQVSIITVQTAYDQLTAEGYLYAKPRAGYYIDPDGTMLAHIARPSPPPKPVDPPKLAAPADQISFSTSGVDLAYFPFSTWAKLTRQVLSTRQESLLQGIPAMGLWELRQAIADHLRAYRNLQATPVQILIGAGTEYLLGLLVQLLGASRRFAVEDPGFPRAKQILRKLGASAIPIPMDDAGMIPDALEHAGATIAYITPSHQFPTGIRMPLRRRRALLDWAAAHPGRYLLEDDYDSELRFQGRPLPALYSLDSGDHVIYLNTFTRTLAPSLRVGYLVLPPGLAAQFMEELSFYSCSVPSFQQYTLYEFLTGSHLEHHLNRIRKRDRQRRAQLLEQLGRHPMGRWIQVQGDQAGTHLVLRVHLPCSEQELIAAAARAHIAVTGLSHYQELTPSDPDAPPGIVLGYACLSEGEIRDGVRRLLDAWQGLAESAT